MLRVRFTLAATACIVTLSSSAVSPVFAQTKGKTNGVTQQQQEQAKQATELLQADVQQLNVAEQQMAAAMANVKKSVKSAEEAEKKAQAQHERSMGLDKLLADQRAAHKDLKDASEPLLNEFHKSEDYAKAKAKAETAKQRLAQLKSNTSLSAADKTRAEREAAEESLGVSLAEKNFLEEHPKLKDLRSNSAKIDKEMSALRAKIHAAVDSDNSVKTAEVELDKARAEFKQAQQTVGQLRQKAGFDRTVAVKEQQEALMAQMLERMQSQRGRGGRGRKR